MAGGRGQFPIPSAVLAPGTGLGQAQVYPPGDPRPRPQLSFPPLSLRPRADVMVEQIVLPFYAQTSFSGLTTPVPTVAHITVSMSIRGDVFWTEVRDQALTPYSTTQQVGNGTIFSDLVNPVELPLEDVIDVLASVSFDQAVSAWALGLAQQYPNAPTGGVIAAYGQARYQYDD